MTADDARALVAKAHERDTSKAGIVLSLWERGIAKAAEQGRTSVRESELDRVRCPIPAASRRLALEKLASNGFLVRTVQEGPNEGTTEVSWA